MHKHKTITYIERRFLDYKIIYNNSNENHPNWKKKPILLISPNKGEASWHWSTSQFTPMKKLPKYPPLPTSPPTYEHSKSPQTYHPSPRPTPIHTHTSRSPTPYPALKDEIHILKTHHPLHKFILARDFNIPKQHNIFYTCQNSISPQFWRCRLVRRPQEHR